MCLKVRKYFWGNKQKYTISNKLEGTKVKVIVCVKSSNRYKKNGLGWDIWVWSFLTATTTKVFRHFFNVILKQQGLKFTFLSNHYGSMISVQPYKIVLSFFIVLGITSSSYELEVGYERFFFNKSVPDCSHQNDFILKK